MKLRELVSDRLSAAVVAAVVFTLYSTYTADIDDPLAIGVGFIISVVAISVGFVVTTPILDRIFVRSTA
jgi:hypothetical protein